MMEYQPDWSIPEVDKHQKTIASLKEEIDSLKAEIDQLRSELNNRKGEIWIRKIWVEDIQFCSPKPKHYEYIPPEEASDD